jgi:cytochrome o ubiquinol oxidase subunit 3
MAKELTINHHGTDSKATHGFWIYLKTDLLMYAVLFATYAVLKGNNLGGESAKELFSLPLALTETLLLLTSSFTCGLGMLAARRGDKKQTMVFFILTLLLGLCFLGFEISEFSELVREGNVPQRSAFLSSFFTLVGTHGLHIASGLIWTVILLLHVAKRGLTAGSVQKLTLLSLFWHFLDIVWIFIFTVVYLFAGLL